MDEQTILERITINTQLSGGKAILRQHLEVERVLALLTEKHLKRCSKHTLGWSEKIFKRVCSMHDS
jgi:hypothetical protein